jgi:hypothetical protein
MPAPENHRDRAGSERDGDNEAGLEQGVRRMERLGEARDDPVGEMEPRHEAQKNRGKPLDEIHHPPAGQPEQAVTILDDRSRERHPKSR